MRDTIAFCVKQFLISVDQTINTLLGGWADESISSRAHRECPRLERVIDTMFFWQKSHCKQAYQNEIDRMQCHPAFRERSK